MDISELISSIDIVDYISQFVDLEERNGEYWGLSCFKEEKTPSFSVRKDPPVFYDYSSGIGGNVITFTKHYYKCSGYHAVDILKKFAGLEGEAIQVTKKLEATTVCKKYSQRKPSQKESKCSILPNDVMNRYEKKNEKLKVWEDEGISRASLDKFQVFYDSFSDRLVYPIRDINGKIVNIGGRTLDPLWKEKKQRKYTYFYSWGSMNVVYGLAENMEHILKAREVILFEGCKSVLLADSWGIHNTGALLTSHLSANQLKLLVGLGCRVVFALDKGVDIRKDHNIDRLKDYVTVEFINDRHELLEDKDSPVDRGNEVFAKLYNERLRYK